MIARIIHIPFIAVLLVFTGACMTHSYALQIKQESERFSFNNIKLGEPAKIALKAVEKQFGSPTSCASEKRSAFSVKRAVIVQRCDFDSLPDMHLAQHKVVSASCLFIDNRLQQIDLEIQPLGKDSRQLLIREISQSLGLNVENKGPVDVWQGRTDSVLLAQQGNFKLRTVNRHYLQEYSDYTNITPRQ